MDKTLQHQKIGVEALTKWNDPEEGRVYGGCFALFDEMGVGKTKQVIDAAQVLYEKGEINKVVVVAPVAVRSVWFDPELGELKKWLYNSSRVIEYHKKVRAWDTNGTKSGLFWMITNYDWIRNDRLGPLLDSCDEKTLLVLDESSAVKSWTAKQTQACLKLRKACGRVILLNGTPIAHSPNDMFAQGEILDSRILGCDGNYYRFRSRYAVMGGFRKKKIVDWVNLEDLQRRFAPYVLRRLKDECLDLPAKLPPVALTVELTKSSWARYKEMRDDMVAWLEGEPSMAPQAVVKAIRLAQLTSGFLGGFNDWDEAREVSTEKLDLFLSWLKDRREEDPNVKLLVWCRFRAELKRLYERLDAEDEYHMGRITGSQKPTDREYAISLLDPRTTPNDKPVIVVGSPQAGGMGLNLASAHNVFYCSNDYNLKTRVQSEDRVHRPGQTHPVSYFDAMAVGPDGQKTIDHIILKSIRTKQAVAEWTTRAWIKELLEE